MTISPSLFAYESHFVDKIMYVVYEGQTATRSNIDFFPLFFTFFGLVGIRDLVVKGDHYYPHVYSLTDQESDRCLSQIRRSKAP